MPGPASPFCPSFPEDFLDQARCAVRSKTIQHRLAQRFQLAMLLQHEPLLPNEAAGARVGLSGRQVRRWRQRWAAGDFGVADFPGRGRKPRFSPPWTRPSSRPSPVRWFRKRNSPLSRQSLADLTARARTALGKSISRSTVWRILATDVLKPWQYDYWIFPRDPQFAEKAGPILDLYAGSWQGRPLTTKDYVISSDEKTSIQARLRCHPTLGPSPGRPLRVEFEYDRGGALQYLAAWDVQRGYVMGRCEFHTGIESFGRLVSQVMEQEPYCSAERVFWIVDNGSSHRGVASVRRLRKAYPNAILVHTPVHASWLNQVEIYFALVQRKVLTPNDFSSLAEVERRLRLYEALSNQTPHPFHWKFDRAKLAELLNRLEAKQAPRAGEEVIMVPA